MANTIVIKGKMASEKLGSLLVSGQKATETQNGAHVVVGSKVSGSTNTYTVSAPTDVTTQKISLVEAPVIIEVNGLRVPLEDPRQFTNPANRPFRVRDLMVGDTLTISVDGFSSAPTVGNYAIPANGSVLLAPASDLTGGTTLAYKVMASTNISVGQDFVTAYELKVVKA